MALLLLGASRVGNRLSGLALDGINLGW